MRLIDADALIKYCDEKWIPLNVDAVKAQPTIEERKEGMWLPYEEWYGEEYYECSVCKEAFTLIDGTPSDNLYNFCPNCGAKMEGNT